ncbi:MULTISPECIES: hypothetical protein [Nostocales]|uniref:Schlafen AlbA-2 domain-containing protein n=3 Tax=Nostocales TaxID=1161 RepID=A0A0C1R9S4_9CYAN|nr:hypothetical protein [Tolypothrix bouteillei]KAF3885271.1 hypothetical protein DA73_0400007215 [Tolypothrix bouteillei VB521301]
MTRTIPTEKFLTVEFKSDRLRLFNRELIEIVVCLANTDVREFYLGVEDDTRLGAVHVRWEDYINSIA